MNKETERMMDDIFFSQNDIPDVYDLIPTPIDCDDDTYNHIEEQLVASFIDTGKVII